MRPDIPSVLADLAAKLRSDIAPELEGFRAGTVSMSAAMLDMVAECWDGAVHNLVEENVALAAILNRGTALCGIPKEAPDAQLAQGDLRVSTLQSQNDRLRSDLIALQAELEQRDDEAAKALEDDVWAELRRSVERRRVGSANF